MKNVLHFDKSNFPQARNLHDDAFVDAARHRLLSAHTATDAREAVREIVANLLGSEEMVLFKVDEQKGALWSYWAFGVDGANHDVVDVFSDPVIEQVLAGHIFVNPNATGKKVVHKNRPVNAFVPIRLGSKVVAALVIFKLLPQKSGISSTDMELLKVISDHAGAALFPKRRKTFLTQLLENE